MHRSKRERWALNEALPNVFQPTRDEVVSAGSGLRGEWAAGAFGGREAITLELGCGQGLFSVDLGRRFPERGVIGVDVKGHRFWRGAQMAHDGRVDNVAFLRTRIQWLDRLFAPDEVDEIWITFADPQEDDKRGTKCLVSTYYLRLYRMILRRGGVLRVKTDSAVFAERARESAGAAGMRVVDVSSNVHGEPEGRFDPELARSLAFVTAFESKWIADGRSIHYVELEAGDPVAAEDADEVHRMLQGPPERVSPRFHGC